MYIYIYIRHVCICMHTHTHTPTRCILPLFFLLFYVSGSEGVHPHSELLNPEATKKDTIVSGFGVFGPSSQGVGFGV